MTTALEADSTSAYGRTLFVPPGTYRLSQSLVVSRAIRLVGASGMGAYHGHTGFLTFSKAMPVLYQSRINGMKLMDTPYSEWARRIVEWLAR